MMSKIPIWSVCILLGACSDSRSDAPITDSMDTSDSAETSDTPILWGEETDTIPAFYAASDVPPSQIERVRTDYETASQSWGNFGPLEYWIVGNDLDAAAELDEEYCAVRIAKDDNLTEADRQTCLQRDYNFEDYARDGGAGLNVVRSDYEAYSVMLITMASKYPYPDETDYISVGYHEYFHVVQSAHIDSRDHEERQRLMVENPWWSEGGAEYMAQLLYSRQPGVESGYLKERMTWKMQSKELLEEGEDFTEIPYSERAIIAYDLGAWFIAYLIHQVGEDAYRVHFYDDLNSEGWEDAFTGNFGMSADAMLADFEDFLDEPLSVQLYIIP